MSVYDGSLEQEPNLPNPEQPQEMRRRLFIVNSAVELMDIVVDAEEAA